MSSRYPARRFLAQPLLAFDFWRYLTTTSPHAGNWALAASCCLMMLMLGSGADKLVLMSGRKDFRTSAKYELACVQVAKTANQNLSSVESFNMAQKIASQKL